MATSAQRNPHSSWEDTYRSKWKWDKVVLSSHAVDCYPAVGSCPYWVFLKEGQIVFEEQRGDIPKVEEGIPDFNPMGCQKGSCWHQFLKGRDRILYPMKRVGPRGSGKWQRISWDQALSEIADGILDAIQEGGPEAIFQPCSPSALAWGITVQQVFAIVTGFPVADFDPDVSDFSPGAMITWGKFACPSEDDRFNSELIIIWHCNPTYTRIPFCHFLTEARYKGTEVVIISPDFSPSAIRTDYHIPVKVGSDAALCLAMCQVVIDEGLMDSAFVKDQTDLPLLVRLDNRQFLREPDLKGEGRDDQFYFYDAKGKRIVEAPLGTLALGEIDPALEGTYSVTLKDGQKVQVAPVFQLLRERLQGYTPERASEMCGVHPEVIRTLARKVATKRTQLYEGLGIGKQYHGDLMDRSMYLLLALTGNWGKKGTGSCWWAFGPSTASLATRQLIPVMPSMMDAIKAQDPTKTDELAGIDVLQNMNSLMGTYVPPIWYWYYHAGYREVWNRRDWNDPSMHREFDDYVREALEKGWWSGVDVPREHQTPRVMIEVGGNMLRRSRGGQSMFLRHLWPKLKLIVSIDVRMSITGLFSDYVLPAAHQYERVSTFALATTGFFNFLDKAVEPAGEALPEFQIYRRLCQKLAERGKARGMTEYQNSRGQTFRLDTLEAAFTDNGALKDEEEITALLVKMTADMGTIPEDTTIETMREKGIVRFTDWGFLPFALVFATDSRPDETIVPFRNHVQKKQPYPTLTRRAQFYIDHPWFLEAGEELPCHKDPPRMGGDYPLLLTSGHNRWSIHSNNIVNRLMLETHRGYPHLVMNPQDAAQRGIQDNDEVRVHNDMGSFQVRVKLSPSVRPGQIICYSGWDHFQFRDWNGPSNLEGGMVKWLHFAGGYGHLRYWPFMWAPSHVDRATRVEVTKIG